MYQLPVHNMLFVHLCKGTNTMCGINCFFNNGQLVVEGRRDDCINTPWASYRIYRLNIQWWNWNDTMEEVDMVSRCIKLGDETNKAECCQRSVFREMYLIVCRCRGTVNSVHPLLINTRTPTFNANTKLKSRLVHRLPGFCVYDIQFLAQQKNSLTSIAVRLINYS